MVKVLSTFGHRVTVDDDKITAIVMVIPVRSIPFQFHRPQNINNHHGMLNVVQVQWQQHIHQELIKIKKWSVDKNISPMNEIPIRSFIQTTTDLHDSCTDDHTGTSGLSTKNSIQISFFFVHLASAPLAAGIFALVLEAK